MCDKWGRTQIVTFDMMYDTRGQSPCVVYVVVEASCPEQALLALGSSQTGWETQTDYPFVTCS